MFDAHGMASVTVTAVVVLFVAGCQKTSGLVLSSKKEVEELSMFESSLTCSQLSPNCTVYWSITNVEGQVKKVGSCTGEGNCWAPFHPTVYPVRQNSSGLSMLTFKNVTREWAGTVTCTERFSNGTEQSVNTMVDVYYNSGDYNSRLVAHRENRTISVILNVTRIFSALGNYAARYRGYCDWDFKRRYRDPLHFTWVPYNNLTSSGQQYYAGYFLLKMPFPSRTHCLHRESIIISPGEKRVSLLREEFESGPDNVIIKHYRLVSTKTNDSEVFPTAYQVSDGNVYIPPDDRLLVTLDCEARNVQPWNSDMIEWGGLCQGQQGFTCSLTSRGVMDDGKKVTCAVTNHVNNGQTSSASVMLKVSEGPKNVSIQYHTSVSANGNCQVNLSCQAPDVRPSTFEMFEWNGFCDDQKGPTCVVVDFSREDDGKWVTCTVTNHINRRHRASASVRLIFSDCVPLLETSPDTDDGFKKGAATGIGATLTLVLLGFCLVLAVVWRRGLLWEVVTLVLRGRIYDQPQPRSLDADHIYEMTAAKDDNPDCVTEHQQQDDATDLSPPGDVYENVQSSSKTQSGTAKPQRRK